MLWMINDISFKQKVVIFLSLWGDQMNCLYLNDSMGGYIEDGCNFFFMLFFYRQESSRFV